MLGLELELSEGGAHSARFVEPTSGTSGGHLGLLTERGCLRSKVALGEAESKDRGWLWSRSQLGPLVMRAQTFLCS